MKRSSKKGAKPLAFEVEAAGADVGVGFVVWEGACELPRAELSLEVVASFRGGTTELVVRVGGTADADASIAARGAARWDTAAVSVSLCRFGGGSPTSSAIRTMLRGRRSCGEQGEVGGVTVGGRGRLTGPLPRAPSGVCATVWFTHADTHTV